MLNAADVHVAMRLASFAGVEDEPVVLAAALAVRAPRLGHVHVDLATIRDTAAVDTEDPVDLSVLPWPEPNAWIAAVAGSGNFYRAYLECPSGNSISEQEKREENRSARQEIVGRSKVSHRAKR